MNQIDEELLLNVVERREFNDDSVQLQVEKATPIEIANELSRDIENANFADLIGFFKSGMFKLLGNDNFDISTDIFLLHRAKYSNLILNTAQTNDQHQNVIKEILCFRLKKSTLTDLLCDLVNLYECHYSNGGNKINIPAALIALNSLCDLSQQCDVTIAQLVTFLMVMNAVIEETRHSMIVESKSLISGYAIECHKSVQNEYASLNIEISTNNIRTSKLKIATLLAKCLNKDVLGHPKLLLSYMVHLCGVKCSSAKDLIQRYYSKIYSSIRFCFCYVGTQLDNAEKIITNCKTLADMGNEFNTSFLIHVFNPALSGTYNLRDIYCEDAVPVLYIHRGTIVKQSISTAKMLHTIFSCNNSFIVTRHDHCIIIESHSCAGSPQISITTGGDCIRIKSGVNVYQKLSLDQKKKSSLWVFITGNSKCFKIPKNKYNAKMC